MGDFCFQNDSVCGCCDVTVQESRAATTVEADPEMQTWWRARTVPRPVGNAGEGRAQA